MVELTDGLIEALDGYPIGEFAELKTAINEYIKDRKDLHKGKMEKFVKEDLTDGDEVTVIYKGEQYEAEVVKINEKSVSVTLEYEGEMIKKPIQFQNVVAE